MKKLVCILLVGIMVTAGFTTTASAGEGRGGFMGFIAGCCFGMRAAGDYNEGKEIHWREWCGLIPYVGIVFSIWSGIDGASGVTTTEYAAQYGSVFY